MSSLKKPEVEPLLFLTDNGSLRADAVLNLRSVAENLTSRLGRLVIPASVLHSSKVPPNELGGTAAETVIPALRRRFHAGHRQMKILPFFLGPSRALTEYLPEKIAQLRSDDPDWAQARIEIAPPLFQPGDNRIARALAERIDSTIARQRLQRPNVVLVDHGSPAPEVTEVRNAIGNQLRLLLGERVGAFSVASMERREGAEYDFNEPLLERVLRQPAYVGPTVIAQLFLSAGRHAGEGGDIAQICEAVERETGRLICHRTAPIGDHPLIEEILAERARTE